MGLAALLGATGLSVAAPASADSAPTPRVVRWGYDGGGQPDAPAGLTGVTALAAGSGHGLALKDDGTVVGWGDDRYGQADVPVGLTGVTAVAAGQSSSLAVKGDGTVVGWGYDRNGETNVPVGLIGVTAVAAGYFHSLALKSDGTVVGWGDDRFGQTDVPAGLTGVTAIAAGGTESLALKGDGTVVAWGDDSSGQTDVPAGLTGVTAVAAGGRHAMALKDDGTVVAWGDDSEGQVDVPSGLTGVTVIAAGALHSLALGRLPAPRQSQTVAFTSVAPSPAVVGGSYTATATGGGSGKPVTFSVDPSSTGGACTVSVAGVVSFTGAGSCVVDADQAGDDGYTAAATVSQTITVVAAPASQPPAFTSGDPATTGTVGTGYAASFTASGSPAPTFSLVTAPTFLTIDTVTGQVSGTPVAVGTFRYAVAARNAAGTATTRTYTVTVGPADWQADVRGYTPPPSGSAQGYTIGVVNNTWTAQVTQPATTRTLFTGTITVDRGTFTGVKGLGLETGDSVSANGATITFRFASRGELDGLTFRTTNQATAVTFTMNIAGKPATARQIFTGASRTLGTTASPVTYRRIPATQTQTQTGSGPVTTTTPTPTSRTVLSYDTCGPVDATTVTSSSAPAHQCADAGDVQPAASSG